MPVGRDGPGRVGSLEEVAGVRWESRGGALLPHTAPRSSPPCVPRTTLGWGSWAGGTEGPGAQVPQRSGGFVYKQWGAGSAAPPGGQCGPGERSRPRLPRPPQSGRGAGGGRLVGAATPQARARWGRRQGAARGPWSLQLLRAGAAPQQQPVIGLSLAWRAGRAHVAAAGWGGAVTAEGGAWARRGSARVRGCGSAGVSLGCVRVSGSEFVLGSAGSGGVSPGECWGCGPSGCAFESPCVFLRFFL